jgi:hypothetical protein
MSYTQMYRVRYVNTLGNVIDEGPFPLHQAEVQAAVASAAQATNITILRDYEERVPARYAIVDDLLGWD